MFSRNRVITHPGKVWGKYLDVFKFSISQKCQKSQGILQIVKKIILDQDYKYFYVELKKSIYSVTVSYCMVSGNYLTFESKVVVFCRRKFYISDDKPLRKFEGAFVDGPDSWVC